MKLKITDQRVFINFPTAKERRNKEGQMVKYYRFSTSLGNNKGFIICKCYNLRHDLTKIKYISNVVADLISYKTNKDPIHTVYEMKIISYSEPKLEDFRNETTIPVKKDKPPFQEQVVDINQELPPQEDMEEQADWVELTNNYGE